MDHVLVERAAWIRVVVGLVAVVVLIACMAVEAAVR